MSSSPWRKARAGISRTSGLKYLSVILLLSIFSLNIINGAAAPGSKAAAAPAAPASVTCGAVSAGVTCTNHGAYIVYELDTPDIG